MPSYPIHLIAIASIVLVLMDWILGFGMSNSGATTQVRKALLGLKVLACFVLFVEVLRRKTGWGWALSAVGISMFAQMSSEMSGFTEVFIIFFVAALTSWRPGGSGTGETRIRLLPLLAVGISAVVLAFLAFWWTGYAKPIWRSMVREGAAGQDSVGRSMKFVQTFRSEEARIDYEALPARLSSGLGFTSLVLERVPRAMAHEQGVLLKRALLHIVRPRILFPDKGDLGGDSWLVARYAGVKVADESSGTSIGLGFLTQFYIDFGYPGVVVLGFLLGVLVATVLEVLRAVSPSYLVFQGASTMILLGNFRTYDGELAKILGGLLTQAILVSGILALAGRPVHNFLVRSSRP